MGARVKDAVAAMCEARGNVTRAACALGISRQALYGLLKRAKIQPRSFSDVVVNIPPLVSTRPVTGVTESASVNSPDQGEPSTFPTMSSAAARQAPSRRPGPRLLPVGIEHYRRLEEAAYDLTAKLRRTMTPALVLDLYLHGLEAWLKKELAKGKDPA